MVCYDGQWYPPNNVCIKLCPALSFPNSVFECTVNGEPVSCERNMQPRTVATRTCKSGYRDESHNAPNICKDNGEWEYKHIDCYTDCGVIDRDYQSNNTEYDDLLTFPWKAGLYMKKGDSNDFEFICSATLLETGNVITAASCVKDSNGSLINSDLLRVGLGKSYMPWNDPRDIHAQKFEVTRASDGYLHALVIGNQISKFKKSLELFEPLSFIFMKGAVDLSAFTRAICIDSIGSNSKIEFLEGEIFGWDRDGNHVSYNITLYTNDYCKTLIFNLRNRDAELEKEIMEFGRFCTDRALPDTLYGSSVMYYDEGEKVFNLVGVLISVHESISIFQGLRDREASQALLHYYNNLISLVAEKQ
ncbi:modular serine protease-like [Nilaparvata lugens]|uniref:modular serine protease-like n=1 Tax=Nilaparvata lugens TaxID=108931 RepID=UPI00193DD8E8|nr:modular serine protease-like [Nilaparvata lugens]XP_039282680.1 modular serine protease-like [Nilaparvata lugens]